MLHFRNQWKYFGGIVYAYSGFVFLINHHAHFLSPYIYPISLDIHKTLAQVQYGLIGERALPKSPGASSCHN
jgi:hypothetical protein